MPRRGFKWDATNTRLSVYVNGTEAVRFDNANPYVTSLVGLTVTTDHLITTAGDHRLTAGNYRLGIVSPFGTTEPTSAMCFYDAVTAPVGTITTSGALYSASGVLRKIIADGTDSAVEA